MRTRVLDEPAHRVEDILARRLLVPVRRVVRQHEDVLRLEVPLLCPARVTVSERGRGGRGRRARTHEELAHVPRVVHAAVQLVALARIVDADLSRG